MKKVFITALSLILLALPFSAESSDLNQYRFDLIESMDYSTIPSDQLIGLVKSILDELGERYDVEGWADFAELNDEYSKLLSDIQERKSILEICDRYLELREASESRDLTEKEQQEVSVLQERIISASNGLILTIENLNLDIDAQIKAYRGLTESYISEYQKKLTENLSKQAIYYDAALRVK